MRMRTLAVCVWTLAAVSSAAIAHADGVCEKGYRDTTAEERAVMTRALETVFAALPPAPEGFVIVNDQDTPDVGVPKGLCRDFEAEPWVYGFTRYYSHMADQEERQAAFASLADKLNALQATKQPRLDALMAKLTELGEKIGAAAQKGDMDLVQKLSAEAEKVGNEYSALADEGTEEPLAEGSYALGKDLEVHINISINSSTVSAAPGAQTLRTPAGAQTAFRWTVDRDSSLQDGHALVLLGPWKSGGSGTFVPGRRAGAPMYAPHTVSVLVTADPERIESTVASIDFKALASLVSK